jgi:hypothetical protein
MLLLALQVSFYAVWFPMKILVIAAILRAGVKRHSLAFLYMVVSLLLVIVQMPVVLAFWRSTARSADRAQFFHAIAQGINYGLILAVVLSFIYSASARLTTRHLVRLLTISSGLLFAGLSFLVHYDHRSTIDVWMTAWARDMNFFSAVLDLVLWALLLGSRDKSPTLLMLSGGMGIMFAGEAIGDAVRSIAIRYRSGSVYLSASVFVLVADVLFLYIWWQAFRKVPTIKRTNILINSA